MWVKGWLKRVVTSMYKKGTVSLEYGSSFSWSSFEIFQ